MKVGDLVEYYGHHTLAVILQINEAGGTVKALLSSGEIGWLVKSECKVANESR